MKISKCLWAVRALSYSLITKIKMPGYIGKPVYISRISGLKMEKRVRIYPGMRLEIGTPEAALVIGENTSIGQNFHAVAYGEPLYIGKNVTISGNVLITNCDHSYQEIGVHILEQDIDTRRTVIGDNCFIGYGAVIQAGSILGTQCVVGANSVVRGVFPDYSVIAGVPAKIVKNYDSNIKQWGKRGS